jgi:diguanylate cyclase (GGDEF)-like protein/PAS domain S-box-containing protein
MTSFEPAFGLDFLEYLEEGVYILDPDRKILSWNRAAERITGYSKEEIVGSRCMDNILIHVDDHGRCLCKEDCPVVSVFAEGKCHEALVYLYHKEGYRVPVAIKALPLKNDRGEITSVIEIFNDRSLQIDAPPDANTKTEQPFVDPVTGFFSHSHLRLKLKSMHSEAATLGKSYGVIVITLKNYEDILQQHGCEKSDRSLRAVAKTIRGLSRTSYLLSRWNQDAFIVAIPNINANAIQLLAAHYQYIINTAKVPADAEQISILVEASALIPGEGDDLESVEAQLEQMTSPD